MPRNGSNRYQNRRVETSDWLLVILSHSVSTDSLWNSLRDKFDVIILVRSECQFLLTTSPAQQKRLTQRAPDWRESARFQAVCVA